MHCLQRNVKRVVRIDVKKAGGGGGINNAYKDNCATR